MMENNQFFYQKVLHIKTQRLRKKEYFCNFCILINTNLLDKNRNQSKVKCHIQYEGSYLR